MSKILEGYSFAEWPNISGDRLPRSSTHVASKSILLSEHSKSKLKSEDINTSVILLAVARVVGAYCGVSDVLLAVQMGQHGKISLVRIVWSGEDTWAEVKVKVDLAIRKALDDPLSVNMAREALSLDNNQYPYLVLCTFDQSVRPQDIEDPPVFSYTSMDSVLHLSASMASIHPTVASQMISQVVGLIQQGSDYPLSSFTSTLSFASNLMSAYERGTDRDVTATYSHVSTVSFAPDYLSERAQDMPHATAVCWYPDLSLDASVLEYESMSYLDFHRKSNRVAQWLLRLGLQSEDRIAVCLDRNLHFHTAMMGILKAGGCYVPIDPELPLERKTYIAQDANAAFVLTSSDIASPEVFGSRTVYIDSEVSQTDIAKENSDDVNFMTPDGLAYLLYTSGTTGNPKGCLLTHHGLSQAILALSSTAAEVRMDNIHDGRYLAVASIAFDVHLGETMVPLALGMPLLSARRSQLLENLPSYVSKLGITHLGIVPSLIEATLNASQGADGSDIGLKYIASGGEKMSDSILDKWADHPQVRLANFYGPSEVTIGCCARYMTSRTPKANIGRPFANVSGYVVDAGMNILLRGGVGELVVEGPLVGRGYHGRPDLTAKVFLDWPRKGCWAYRTGDLVRMMPDCTIEILGRIDTQIKLRGVRIESEGISAIIRRAVASTDTLTLDATTVLVKHPAINVDQLVSFFTWDTTVTVSTRKSQKPNISIPPANLLKHIKIKCDSELPSYMRPSHFIPLNWLPLSSNGKIDAKVVIELFKQLDVEVIAKLSVSHEAQQTRPCTELEFRVFGILQNHIAIQQENARPDINIFECGLDSMGVIRFTTELKDVFEAKISAAQVMKAPCIVDIASYVAASVDARKIQVNASFKIPAIDEIYSTYSSDRIEDVLPPFTVQEGVLSRSADLDTLYVQHVLVACKPVVSMALLRLAWTRVVERNHILRTVFHFGRTLSQVILNTRSCSLNWVDKEIPSLGNAQTFPQLFMAQEAPLISKQINHNISVVPPYQLSVYSSTDETYLALSIHHAIFDGISLPRVFEQVEREYLGLGHHPKAEISEILGHISSTDEESAQKFWEDYFVGYAWPQNTLYPSMPAPTQRLSLPLKSSLSSIKRLAASQRVTMQALFTCAFGQLLASKVYKRRDVAFGVLRSGRLLPVDYIEESTCPLVAVLPVRIDFGAPHISLQTIQEGISSTIEYENLPLGKVQGWVRPAMPLFEILFSVSVNELAHSTLWEVIESEPPEADYPLAVEIVIEPSTDSISLKAAWMDQGHTDSPRMWLCDLEDVVHFLAEDPVAYLSQSLAQVPQSSCEQGDFGLLPERGGSVANDSIPDPALISDLRIVISDFMGFNPIILTPSLSLISLGLDSIKAVGLAKAITKQGFLVTSTDILQHATLNQLANCIKSKQFHEDKPPIQSFPGPSQLLLSEIDVDSVKLGEEDIEFFPTTALQSGMLSQTVNSKGQLYVHAFPLRISGSVDNDRMHNTWKKAVDTFAILRTSFHFSTESGVWLQAVHSCSPLNWEAILVASKEDYKRELEGFMASIDLSDETCYTQPPIWVRLFQSKENEMSASYLVFVMHHALYDGTSIGKLVFAVEKHYAGLTMETQIQFHELLPHFLHQEKEGTSFWLDRVRQYKPKLLRRIHPSSLFSTSATVERNITLDSVQVKQIVRQASVTMQCLCQAAWAKVLSKYTGSTEIVFGHTVSGRNIPGAEDVIGPVLNTIPCCIRLAIGARNIDLLRSIHQSNLDALPWQQSSARTIQKALGVETLWDSLFLFQPAENLRCNELAPFWTFDEDIVVDEAKVQYPLNVELTQHNDGITIKCASHPDYINQNDLALVAEDFHTSLADILNDPHATVAEGINKLHGYSMPFSGHNGKSDQLVYNNLCASDSPGLPVSVDTFAYQSIITAITNAPMSLMKPETPLAALGIDSIMAIQIVGKFRQSGMKIMASDVVTSRTIGDMISKVTPLKLIQVHSKLMKATITDKEKTDVLTLFGNRAQDIEGIAVMSSGMKWLIGAWQKSMGTRYQHVFAFQLPQDIDIPRMRDSWSSLVERHPILRSTFACPEGYHAPRLVTFKSVGESWSEKYVEEDVFFRSILSQMKSMVSNPPSLISPPTRALLFHSIHHRYLILHLYHFQYDAWSLQLLLHELSGLYRNMKPTTSNNLQAFLDYSANTEHLADQEEYWKSHFPSGFKPTLFPALNPKVKNVNSKRRFIKTNMNCIPNASRCEERARILGISLQSVFLACWAFLQASVSTSSSSTFGLWHSGRTGAVDDVANLAVPCMNVLPIHVPGINEKGILQIARWIQSHLPKRTSAIEQSDQVRVNEWVGLEGKAICNIFVNIVKVAPAISAQDPILEPVNAPYFVPDRVTMEDDACTGELSIAKIMNDDIFIDIATITRTNSVMMSVDAAPNMLDEKQADALIRRWGNSVEECLGVL